MSLKLNETLHRTVSFMCLLSSQGALGFSPSFSPSSSSSSLFFSPADLFLACLGVSFPAAPLPSPSPSPSFSSWFWSPSLSSRVRNVG